MTLPSRSREMRSRAPRDVEQEEATLAETANPAVFRAYVELQGVRSGPLRVAILEALYHAGWKDALQPLGEGNDRFQLDREEGR